MSTHLTIKNENRPNPRSATVLFSLVLVAGDMICFVVKSENLMKSGSVKQTSDRHKTINMTCCCLSSHSNQIESSISQRSTNYN